jgi:hypothetical protein
MPVINGTAHARPSGRKAKAPGVRLIRLKSPKAQRERAGTFVGAYEQSQKSQLQHQPPIARYVTSDAKETLVTNYKIVIESSVIEW